MGTVMVTFKSPDSRFTDEKIVVWFDGTYHVDNWAKSRTDGLWHCGMSFVFGPRTLEAIQKINPYKL